MWLTPIYPLDPDTQTTSFKKRSSFFPQVGWVSLPRPTPAICRPPSQHCAGGCESWQHKGGIRNYEEQINYPNDKNLKIKSRERQALHCSICWRNWEAVEGNWNSSRSWVYKVTQAKEKWFEETAVVALKAAGSSLKMGRENLLPSVPLPSNWAASFCPGRHCLNYARSSSSTREGIPLFVFFSKRPFSVIYSLGWTFKLIESIFKNWTYTFGDN